MEVGDWLQGLGLAQYEQAFRDNAIDGEVLARLTADDLKDIGIAVVGHRRKLLDAIAELRSAAQPEGLKQSRPPERKAERRQLTVMFVDLVGSTALAGRLDLEDMREVITAYQTTVAGVVTRFDGHIAKYMGDGVLCYFGWPKADEHDPERAVRAGLAIVDAVAKLRSRQAGPIAARVGIATGLVVVGDLIGEGPAQEEAVVGETPNLAARLQAVAEPGEVVVAEATRRLLGELFEFELVTHELRGFAGQVVAYRACDHGLQESRFEALRGEHLTPLVGRTPELDLLLDRWKQAREGDGQVVLISGEPGLGKSRMLKSLRERLADEAHVRVSYFCSPYHQNTALHPFLDQIERAAGYDRNDSPELKLEKLESVFAASGQQPREAATLTAELLGIPLASPQPSNTLSPQARRAKLQQIWLDQLVGLAARLPIIVVVEDAHWIDPSSRDQLELMINRLQRLPALLLVTFRPEFEHSWGGYPHVTTLSLNRLGPRQSAAMIEQIVSGKALPSEILEQAVAKADGVPLFLEEIIKGVLESGLLRDAGDHFELSGPLRPMSIPATLRDSLMARLDRMGPAKEVAQIASVIGREFSYDLLAGVAGLAERTLAALVGDLAAAELIFRRSVSPVVVYGFKHALVQDAAYRSLLRGKRQQIHAQIAQVLEDRFPEEPPEVLAHHLTEAGQVNDSVEWWAHAGHQAVARAASKEAVNHFERALAQLQTLPETDERKRREAALQNALAGAVINVAGIASDALENTLVRARDLWHQLGDTDQQFVVEWGLWHVYVGRADVPRAQAQTERLIAWAEREGDPSHRLQACHAEWSVLGFGGAQLATRRSCERGWALYDEEKHADHAFLYGGHDPGVCNRCQISRALWCLGYPDRALACYEEGLALARRLSHPQIVLHGLNWGLSLFQLFRDDASLEAMAEEALNLATEQGFPDYQSAALMMRGWSLSRRGNAHHGTELIRNGLAERQSRGTILGRRYYLSLLACAERQAGNTSAGIAAVDEALGAPHANIDVWLEPELMRIRGELLLDSGATMRDEAERCFRWAIESARATESPGWELRSAVSLARLVSEQGRRLEARHLLEPVYGWFTECFDTPDLLDAKTLLSQIT